MRNLGLLLVLTALAGGLGLAGVSAAQSPPGQGGNSATISYPPGEQAGPGSNTLLAANGTASVTINFTAFCSPPNTISGNYWNISIALDDQYGHTQGQLLLEQGTHTVNDSEGFGATIPQGEKSDTFTWTVTLSCNGMDTEIGSGSFTVEQCDSDDYEAARHKFETAEKLIEKGNEYLKEARELDEDMDQENKDEAAKAAIDGTALATLVTALEHGAVLTPHIAAAIEAAHVLNDLFELNEKAWLFGEDYIRLTGGASDDFLAADELIYQAKLQLARALAGCGKPPADEYKKLLDDQDLDDRALAIINTWEHSESETLYRNPVTREWESVDLALKQVKTELSGGQQHGANEVAREARATHGARFTLTQLKAAIRYLNQARDLIRKLGGQLARVEAADDTAIERLTALLG